MLGVKVRGHIIHLLPSSLFTTTVSPIQVDAVWDTQSLVSINPRDRKQYVRTVKSLLSEQFKYLLGNLLELLSSKQFSLN